MRFIHAQPAAAPELPLAAGARRYGQRGAGAGVRIQPAAFGFACAVHPEDPDTAWFVPEIKDERRIPVDGRLVVNRTRDGGKTFETLHRGLPQEHAYDLVYRHGLDVAGNGELLAMGSTTGSLFISENAGDDWQCISAHLPPVYAVRFAPGEG